MQAIQLHKEQTSIGWLLTIFLPSTRIYDRIWHEVNYSLKDDSTLTSWTTISFRLTNWITNEQWERTEKQSITWKKHENNYVKSLFLTLGTNRLNDTWIHLKQMISGWIILLWWGNAVGWKTNRTDDLKVLKLTHMLPWHVTDAEGGGGVS